MAKELLGTIKEVVGTCLSIGCTIEGSSPKDIIRQINDGEIACPVINIKSI